VVLLAGMHEPEAHAGQPTPGGRLGRAQAKGDHPCSSEPSR
jgi:hypothetical protein